MTLRYARATSIRQILVSAFRRPPVNRAERLVVK